MKKALSFSAPPVTVHMYIVSIFTLLSILSIAWILNYLVSVSGNSLSHCFECFMFHCLVTLPKIL